MLLRQNLRRFSALSAIFLIIGGPAMAQNIALAPPAAATITLNTGFADDPHVTPIQAGGPIGLQAGRNGLPEGCAGATTDAPTARLNYTAGTEFPLNIFARGTDDLTLAVNLPDGTWACDDDSGGDLSPLLSFGSPQSGLYDIWVGNLSQATPNAAQLYISEITSGIEANAQGVDLTADPAYGSVSLTSGFTPDPQTVSVLAGGPIDASQFGAGCIGAMGAVPDYRVNYTAGQFPLSFMAVSDTDIALAINLPDGSWVCDDDSAGDLNPLVRIGTPASGAYDIFVTSLVADQNPPAVLGITEIDGQ